MQRSALVQGLAAAIAEEMREGSALRVDIHAVVHRLAGANDKRASSADCCVWVRRRDRDADGVVQSTHGEPSMSARTSLQESRTIELICSSLNVCASCRTRAACCDRGSVKKKPVRREPQPR